MVLLEDKELAADLAHDSYRVRKMLWQSERQI